MKKQPAKKYGEAVKQHAVNLRLISGFPYAEIAIETGLTEGYIRKLVHEKNAASVTPKMEKVADVTQTVTQVSNDVAPTITGEKEPINTLEVKVLQKNSVTEPGFFATHFNLMDCVVYTHGVTTSFAIWNVLPGIPGAAIAAIYALMLLDAILNVKRAELPETAEAASHRVVFMEIVAAIAQAHMINLYLWQNLEKLPFPVYRGMKLIETRNEAMEIQYQAEWVNGDWVGLLSVVIAALMAVAACHAVFFTKNAAKEERTKNATANATT